MQSGYRTLSRAAALAALVLFAAISQGSAQITCYTVPSDAGEINCFASTPNFQAATIEACCVEGEGHFFEGGGDESCQACIVFGFFRGSEISLPEQGEATILEIGFIKGGNVQQLTGIDRRNTARFGIIVAGSATEGPNADFTIQPTSFEIEGPDARVPFGLTTFVRIDGVALEPAEDFTLTVEGRNNAGRAIIDPTLPGQFVSPTIRVIIDDVENATLQFTESDYSNPEGELLIVPVVQLLSGIATDLTVRIVPLNITEALARELPSAFPTIPPFDSRVPNIATSDADFSTTPQEITFVAGGTTTIPLNPGIAIVDDDINEVEQLFALFLEVVTAIDPARVDLTSERFATLGRIFDDDPINVGFEQERYTVFEATDATGQLIPIPIIKENDQESEITFEVIATLTLGSGPTAAQPGEDFEAEPPVQRQPFQPDEQEIDYRYELFDDTPANPDVPEPTETFQIQLSLADEGLTNINLGASGGSLFATATVVIIDDDDVIIGWERNVTCVNESESILELCVLVMNLDDTVEFPAGFEVSLAANTIRDTAADPGDYTALVADSDVFFDVIDDDTRRVCIEVVIINDTLLEITESFSIEVVPDPFVANFPSNVQLEPALTFVKILDNDFVRIGFNQTEYGPAVEGTDNVATVYVAVLEGDLQRSVSVTFSTASGTATADADFDSVTRELTFDIDTKVIAVEIPINNDSFFEQFLETFTVSLTRDPADPDDEVILDPDVATVSIQDDEVVVIGYAPVLYTVEEVDSTGEVDVTIRLLQGDLTGLTASTAIPIDVSAASFTATAGSDFNFAPRTLQFDELNTVFTLTVSIIDDDLTEGPEVFFMLAQSSDIRVQIRPDQANVTIIDDDPTVIGFVNAPVSVVESAGPAILQVALISGSLEREVFVDFVTQDGTAVAPGDYTTTTQRLTFGPSSVVGVPSNVPVDITSDEVLEDDESFGASLTLVNTPLIVAVVPNVAMVTIEDDDAAQIGFVPDSYIVNEEDGSVTLTVRVISGSLAREVEVGFMTENDEALAGEDYSAISETLTFSSTVIERTVTVPILSDNFFEFRERFFGNLTLLSTGVNVIVSPSRADVFIDDDDELTIGFDPDNYTVNEDVVTVNLIVVVREGRPGPGTSVTVDYQLLDGTAVVVSDYVRNLGQLTFTNTDLSRNIPVGIVNDGTVELEEFFVGNLFGGPVDPRFTLSPDNANVTIVDDDNSTIGFTQDAYEVIEDAGFVTVTVAVSDGILDREVVITLETSDGTAVSVPGEPDFVARTISLTFSPSISSIDVPIQIIDDLLLENLREQFTSMLTLVTTDLAVTLRPASVPITIIDNDRVVIGFEQPIYEVEENDGSVNVRILVLMGDLRRDVVVSVSTQDDTAVDGSDYTGRGTLDFTFSQFVTTFDIPYVILDDDIHENTEYFTGILSTADDRTILNPNSTRIRILDNDPLLFTFERPMYMFFEDSGIGTVCVNKTGETTETVQIMIQGDLQPGLGTIDQILTFQPDEDEICVDFPIDDDNIALEPPEILTFTITVIDPIPGIGIDPYGTTIVTIVDEDLLFISLEKLQTIPENSGLVRACATFSNPFAQSFELTAQSGFNVSGPAASANDLGVISTTLQAVPGQSEVCFDISIIDDPFVEELLECFTLEIDLGPNSPDDIILNPSTDAVCCIEDNDRVTIGFDPDFYSVQEDMGQVVLTVSILQGELERPVEVIFDTNDGLGLNPAFAPGDYTSVFGTVLQFDATTISRDVIVPIEDDDLLEAVESFLATLTTSDGVVDLDPSEALIEIVDEDRVRIGFDPESYTVDEEDGSVTVTVSVLEGTLAISVVVDFATIPGTAGFLDFTDTPLLLEFNPAVPTRDVVIPILDDSIVEATETFFATLTLTTSPAQAVDLDPSQADITILDPVDTVTIGFEQTTYTVDEGVAVQVCVLVIAGTLDRDAIVQLSSINDEAVAPGDYVPITEDLTFSASETRICRDVMSEEDTILEDDEDFTLTLTTTDGSVNLAPDEATVTIIDDDLVTIGFEQTLYTATEGVDPVVELCAIVFGGTELEREVVVSFATRDGSATSIAPVDYEETITDFTFGPGIDRLCVDVPIVNDDILEGNEQFFGTLTTTDPDVLVNPDEATVTIIEDPNDSVTIGFDPDTYSIVEGDRPVTVTVRLLSGTLETTVDVSLHTSGATATADVDYDDIPPSESISLVFDPVNSVRTVDIDIIDDDALEPIEVFFGELSTTFSTVVLDPQRANISIIDNDGVTIGFLETIYTADEDDGTVELLVGIISGEVTKDIVVRFYTEDRTAVEPMDYLAVDMPITFSPTVSRIMVPVTIINDLVDEEQEEFVAELELITVTNVTVAPREATVFIDDDDGVIIGLDETTYTVDEDVGTLEICAILRNGTLDRDAVVTLSTSDDTAVAPMDYGAITVQLTFSATVSRACGIVTIVNDDEFEVDESFDVTLTTTDGDVTLDPDSGTVTIIDEDELVIGYEFTEYIVDENAGQVEVCAVVTSGIVGTPVQVNYNLEENTATEPEDYNLPATLAYNFAIGATSDCVDIPIVNDTFVDREFMESFFGELIGTDPVSSRITLDPARTTIIIVDNDDQLRIGFVEIEYSVQETDVSVNVEVAILEGTLEPGLQVTVALSESDGSAVDVEDYQSIGTVNLIFSSTTTLIGTTTFIVNDNIDELEEFFSASLNLVTVRPNIIVSPAEATVAILDDDEVVIGLEQTRYTVTEDETVVQVCAILMIGQLQREVIVTLQTSDITAEAPDDYETVAADLTFSATVSRSCANVTIHEDDLSEGPEEIGITLTTTDGDVTLDPFEGVIVIEDDDEILVRFVESSYTFGEADGTGIIQVEKTGIVQEPFTVSVQGGPSTQTDVVISGVRVDTTVTFGAGPAAPSVIDVVVQINDDQVGLEAVEMFSVSLALTQPSDAVEVGQPDVTVVNIIDDDDVTIRFGRTELRVNESAGTFMMCVLKNRDTIVPVTVDILLIPGSATQDVDYDSTTIPTSVTIQPTSDRFCFNGDIINDLIALEGDEDFQLMLVNPSPSGVTITDDTTTIIIVDDDVVAVSFEQPSYTFNENDGVGRICLTKDLESAVPFTVNTVTEDDTAISPDDYAGGTRPVTFETAADDVQCIDITIVPDSEREPIECFDVNLQIPASIAGSVVPGVPSTARVCIEDVGQLVNDTIIGDPLFIVPILISEADQTAIGSDRVSLCYEIHGSPSRWFNLVTDECTSVNAYYTNFTSFLNIIERVAIRATDDAGRCREIVVNLDGCTTTLDGMNVNISRYEADGVRIRRYPRRVRVAVPNCAELSLIMWITCETRTLSDPYDANGAEIVGDMLRFDVMRGLNFGHSDSHGLIGQFWNILIDLSPFNGTLRPGFTGENRYEIDFDRAGSPQRVFTGYFYPLTWDQQEGPCLYAGNREGGPLLEVLSPNDPVIEGTSADYQVPGAFDETGYIFSRFDDSQC